VSICSKTVRSQYVSLRPHVGVFEIPIQREEDDKKVPVKMAWQLSLKNTGKVPALVTKEKHTCQLQQGQRNVPFPGIGKPAPNNTFLILPDQTGRLSTSFVGDVMGVKVQDVYDGKAILTCDTELSYTSKVTGEQTSERSAAPQNA